MNEKLEDYCTLNSSHVPDYLDDLERETNIKMLNPRMLTGPLQGRLLSLVSKLIRPVNILEIGTFTGYSSLCLAEGLKENGQLDTIEINEELKPIISKYVLRSPFRNKIRVHFGDALKMMDRFEGPFQLVFIDAAKEDYIEYFEAVVDLVDSGGIILADNVLWSGKVITDPEDETTRMIHRFNRHVLADKRVENVILPLRDGLNLIRKK